MAKFVALLTFADLEKRMELLADHRAYLQRLAGEGKLVASGPFVDGAGAMIIYEAADEAEARALIAADPFTDTGVVGDLQLREWNRVFSA